MTQRWEYRILTIPASSFLGLGAGKFDAQAVTDRLNDLGNDGWEIVCMFDTQRHHGATLDIVAVLKRPVEE